MINGPTTEHLSSRRTASDILDEKRAHHCLLHKKLDQMRLSKRKGRYSDINVISDLSIVTPPHKNNMVMAP